MSLTDEQEFDLSLLSEAELADDPHPNLPLRLKVLGYDPDDQLNTAVEIRTTPQQFGQLWARYRAIQLTLAQRERKRALLELERETPVDRARCKALEEERAGRPDMADPLAHLQLLDRLRRGLETLGPVPEDSPPGDSQ